MAIPEPHPPNPSSRLPQAVTLELGGWGNLPRETCRVVRPDGPGALRGAVACREWADLIPRGLGRSYGDPALNPSGAVVEMTRHDELIALDPDSPAVRCRAGISLADLLDVLEPRGLSLPVVPGTRHVTVGGAIAADVHGKNHHLVGSFAVCVEDLDLLLADGGLLHCSREEHPEAFWATVGGMGLTGVIVAATLRLRRLETVWCRVRTLRTRDLDHTLELFETTADLHPYSVAWIDCLARGGRLGRSVLMSGRDAKRAELPERHRSRPLQPPSRPALAVPLPLPGWLLNPWTVAAFNATYYAAHRDGERLQDARSYFHPLDGVADWNRVYGRGGFVQYQALLPPESSRRGLVELLEEISRARAASFLSVLKTTGPASGGILSYLHRGHTLALDLPNTGERLRALARRLDEILLRHGGRLYLAKDALTTAESFASMYPELARFREVKARLDPDRRFVSSQARRLGIVEAS